MFYVAVGTQAEDDNDEEYYRARLLNDHSASNSETDEIPIASTSTHGTNIEQAGNLSQETDHEDEEEQARQLLLEQSDASEEDDEQSLQPCIRLKRISPTDAERYMPPAWKDHQHSTNASSSSSSSDEEEDYNIKYRTRKSLKKTDKSSNQSAISKNSLRKKSKDIFINYNIPSVTDEVSLADSLTIAEDIGPIDDDGTLQELIENNDHQSIFDSLVAAQDKPTEPVPTETVPSVISVESIDQQSAEEDSTDDR